MADNVTFQSATPATPAAATVVATEELADGSQAQLILLNGSPTARAPITAGQQAAASSLPVVLASDQALPLPTGAATEAKLEQLRALLAGTLSLAGTVALDAPTLAALETVSAVVSGDVGLVADARTGALTSGTYTLSATPGTVLSIPIPDSARGFVAEASAAARFAVGEDPAAEGAGALAVGGRLKATTETTRLLASGSGRTLRLRSTTASATVYVEYF